jgi:hypothetical protein
MSDTDHDWQSAIVKAAGSGLRSLFTGLWYGLVVGVILGLLLLGIGTNHVSR